MLSYFKYMLIYVKIRIINVYSSICDILKGPKQTQVCDPRPLLGEKTTLSKPRH